MSRSFSGVVEYATGRPAAGVRVRLFDKDVIGDDDDLTVDEGLSDNQGRFEVTYKPEKKFNFSDIFLPYLRFEYEFNNRSKTHHAFVQPFTAEYRLPDIPPVKFIPAENGYQFVNSYPGYWIPFSIPQIPDIPAVDKHYGLCGGMVASSLDFLLAGRQIPQRKRRPGRATLLHQYIHQRQVDSLDVLGKQVVRFARWMVLPDNAVQRRTLGEVNDLKKMLDRGNPSPIGLVYVGTKDTLEIWKNHQVLAVDYKEQNGRISIQIYDPNYPRMNDVTIECQPDGQGGLLSEQIVGTKKKKHVRGFFIMPYTPVTPPGYLTPDV